MTKIDKFEEFKTDFDSVLKRFANVAPLAAPGSANLSAVAVSAQKFRNSMALALECADPGPLSNQDHELLSYFVERSNIMLDIAEIITSSTSDTTTAFNEARLARNLSSIAPENLMLFAQVASGDVTGLSRCQLNTGPTAYSGISLGIGRIVVEIIKSLLTGIGFFLLLRRLINLEQFSTGVAFLVAVDNFLFGEQTPEQDGEPMVKPAGFTLCLEQGTAQEFNLKAGSKIRVRFATYNDRAGTELLSVEELGSDQLADLLKLKETSREIQGPATIRVNLLQIGGAKATAMVSFV